MEEAAEARDGRAAEAAALTTRRALAQDEAAAAKQLKEDAETRWVTRLVEPFHLGPTPNPDPNPHPSPSPSPSP
jgi:hypothetical protein